MMNPGGPWLLAAIVSLAFWTTVAPAVKGEHKKGEEKQGGKVGRVLTGESLLTFLKNMGYQPEVTKSPIGGNIHTLTIK